MNATLAAGLPEALRAPLLWVQSERGNAGGKRCRDYTVRSAGGQPLLTGRAFTWGRDVVLADAAGGRPILRLRRSRLFPITGRVAVAVLPGEAPCGTLHRSGRFVDAHGNRGRFRAARSIRDQAGEASLQVILDVALGMGGEGSQLSGPTAFVATIGGRPAAALARKRLPFTGPEESARSGAASFVQRMLGPRLRRLLRTRGPTGWALERQEPFPDVDPLLFLAAALFTIELSHW